MSNIGKKAKQLFSLFARTLFHLFGGKEYILFESNPNYSDSPRKIYDELIRRGLSSKYHLRWVIWDEPTKDSSVDSLPWDKTINAVKNPFSFFWIRNLAIASVCCNRSLHVPRRFSKLSSFYITHGTPIKSTKNYYFISPKIDCVICASEKVKEIVAREANYPMEKTIPLGLPRNDDLLQGDLDLERIFNTKNNKFIVWYPTYRQHKNGKVVLSNCAALPILHSKSIAEEINDFLQSIGTTLIIKPHPAQDLSMLSLESYSQIKIINDDFFDKNNISSYQFVGSCDALITDYSSIFYDFTLCRKPIALIWEDIDEYRRNPGIAEGCEVFLERCHIVKTLDDFKSFLGTVDQEKLSSSEHFGQLAEEVNFSLQPDNTKRVTDYIIKTAGL